MHIIAIDPRSLAVGMVQVATKKFYNWTTTGWETPFDPGKHLLALTPFEPPPGLHSAFQYADVGSELLARNDVSLLIYAVDGGTPTALVDCWMYGANANPYGCAGGLTRG